MAANVGIEAVDGLEGVQEVEGAVDRDCGWERCGGLVGEGRFEHGAGRPSLEVVAGWSTILVVVVLGCTQEAVQSSTMPAADSVDAKTQMDAV